MKRIISSDYSEMERVLTPLGFEHQGGGCFYYDLTNTLFDFSATSIEGVVFEIFHKGVRHGAESAQERLRRALGLE